MRGDTWFLIADSGSTQISASIWTILTFSEVLWSMYGQKQENGQKQDFAKSEQKNAVYKKRSTPRKNSVSKVPAVKRSTVFFLIFEIH